MTPAQSRMPGMRESICAALLKGPAHEPNARAASFEFRFSASDPVFAGHFPGQPLLPGVFQIEMTRVAAESALGSTLELREIVRAKFLRPILPEETIHLNLKFSEESSIIQARATLVAAGQTAGEAVLKLCRSL